MNPAADGAMDGDGFSGSAQLRLGGTDLDVQADLRGQFDPIDGRYHWYGRLDRHDGLTVAMAGQGRAAGVLTTPEGTADCELSDPDPWQRYRVSGISTPPFRSELADAAGFAASATDEGAGTTAAASAASSAASATSAAYSTASAAAPAESAAAPAASAAAPAAASRATAASGPAAPGRHERRPGAHDAADRKTAMTDPGLRGKVAVVTGAARGIGAALALELARRGASVALVGLEPAELAAVAERCAAMSPARAWQADVTDRERMSEVAAEVAAHFGGIDVVVANAGIAIGGPFADADPAEFDRVIAVNLVGSATTARAFLPGLAASAGYFLQIASVAAMAPAALMGAYCASKSGVEALAHVLRAEVAHRGVAVGVAYLSWTDTDMVRGADADPVLADMRKRLPWPANQTAPLDPAIRRLATGIARRSPRIYAQPWIRLLQWLPRGALPAMVSARGAAEVGRVAGRLTETADQRRRPVGPGGAAGSAAALEDRTFR
jgi:NAD(P)-dependent dehydrogenase (short-subunit alcohol dehydrogenase family)